MKYLTNTRNLIDSNDMQQNVNYALKCFAYTCHIISSFFVKSDKNAMQSYLLLLRNETFLFCSMYLFLIMNAKKFAFGIKNLIMIFFYG